MDAVKAGGDRQELHERIRVHSIASGAVVKEQGLPNDLIKRIAADQLFGLTEDEIMANMDARKYVGRSPEQVTEFLNNDVRPVLAKYSGLINELGTDLKV